MNSSFWIKVNTQEIADKLNSTAESIQSKIDPFIHNLSAQTHAFIVKRANEHFTSDFERQFYLGTGKHGKDNTDQSDKHPSVDRNAKNLTWKKISDGIWVVELNSRANWLEEGRARTFMGEDWWLLKPGVSKRAKDGSTYRAIPMPLMQGNKPTFNVGMLGEGPNKVLADSIKKAAKMQGVSLKKIEKDESGNPIAGAVDPKTGLQGRKVLHKLNVAEPPGGRSAYGLFYSRPRTAEESAATGLKPHGGIFHAQGAVVTQKQVGKNRFQKETIVFRVISSKHRADNRWYYPEVKGAHLFKEAYKHANEQIEAAIKAIEQEVENTWQS